MRSLVSLVLLGALTASAGAVTGRQTRRVIADELTAMPAANIKRPLRVQPTLRNSNATPAWLAFSLSVGGTWRATWDAATAVPSRIYGSGIAAPGANASPAKAVAYARQLLADHVALLAPGASASDFVLVSNHSDGEMRSIGFVQYASGLRVVGGQVSFRFKADRMFMIGSEALPHVKIDRPRSRMVTHMLAARGADNLRSTLELPDGVATAPGADVVLPLVADDVVLGYRVVAPMTIDGGADGKYLAYVDPASGEIVAVHQQNLYATGQLLYRSVDRNPNRPRVDVGAHAAKVAIDAIAQTTTPAGMLTWSPEATVTVTTSVLGDFVTIVNKAGTDAPLVSTQLALDPSGIAIWDETADEKKDSQVNVFIATNMVKDFVRANLDAALPGINDPTIANVNIAQGCNAFFDGKSINFFHKTTMCQNTGLVQDVVFHEYGHAVHTAEIIEGVGGFDGAMSEGAADFLAAQMTNDSGMGRGFFHDEKPLRELDPTDSEYSWPKDISEIHHTGLIYGGTFWDLRKALLAAKPAAEANALVNKLFLATMRRSVNIPSSMFEALAADDDDGNLANGTPNECFIRDAYGRHGLRTATGVVAAPGALASSANAVVIRVDLSGLSDRCLGDEIDTLELHWKPGGSATMPQAGSVVMTKVDDARYWAQLPLAQNDVTYYQTKVKFVDGSQLLLPDNLADQFYSAYSGVTVPLYCTSFETDPFAEGWTTGARTEANEPIESNWKWGAPAGGSTDPNDAFTGANILAMNLSGDYGAKSTSWVELPEIDVGHWSDVRLQYRRWLAVEDAHFDQARVTVNGERAWINFDSNMGDSSSLHHIDKEWRFHDVGVTGYAFGTKLKIGFDLTTDEGLELGGWQLDELCVVANVNSVCGDGVKTTTEQCDEGELNADEPGRCRSYCRLPTCGDAIVDKNEECDDGPTGSDECTDKCEHDGGKTIGGCCSSSRGAGGALALGALVGALLLVPRRRRRTSGI